MHNNYAKVKTKSLEREKIITNRNELTQQEWINVLRKWFYNLKRNVYNNK